MLLYLVSAGRCLEAMIGLPTLALNILKAFNMDISLDVEEKLSPMVYGET